MRWNDKQLKAVDTHGKNILVSAAAGSGKTSVLTERILRLITEPERRVPIKEFLVVTFTEAAASEMKSRIAAALTLAAGEDPSDSEKTRFIETQLRMLGTAKIMTFHAFCLTVLKRYCYTIDLDPSFSVIDEKQAEALKEEALDEVFTAAFNDPNKAFREEFTKLLFAYADVRGENKIRAKILGTFEFIMTLPEPFEWLKNSVDALFVSGNDIDNIPAVRFAGEEIMYMLKEARLLFEQVGYLLSSGGLQNLAVKNSLDLDKVSYIEKTFINSGKLEVYHLLKDLSFEVFRASRSEKESYERVKELVKLRRDRVKRILRKDIADLLFARQDDEYAEEIVHITPYARTLETLVKNFSEIYSRIKRSEKVIDFTDFEHMALKILKDENIASDYKRRFSYIYIDEYQDSNYVQEALISRLSRGDNVFMVGDVKQSIYSFRNAAPEIFLSKQKSFSKDEEEESRDLRIDLAMNYRSKTRVIGAVNSLFENLMESHYSGMDYDEDARLTTGIIYSPEAEGKDYEGKAELHLVRKDTNRETFANDAEGEAALCIEIIKNTVGKEFYDTKKGVRRKIRYSDIAILLRTAKNTADIYRKVLKEGGIPAVTDRGEGYFQKVEIDTFLALLRAIVNIRRDIPLAASMCSVVFGFELCELADIRAGKTDGFFYTSFLEYAESGNDPALREKCKTAADRLVKWRDEERFMRLDDFLWKLMRESGFFDYAGSLPGGSLRQANLLALLDRAADFQKGRIEGLREFLFRLDKIKDRGGAAQVTLLTGTEDVCRILTIHGSKGLEFPVVILGGLGKLFSQRGSGDDTLLFHRDAGLSLEWKDPQTHTYKKTLLHRALKLRIERDERAEAIRLFYVGMTRAMDTLHMIGTLSDPQKWIDLYNMSEASPAIDTDISGATSYLGLLMPTAMKKREFFNVTVRDPESLVLDNVAPPVITEGAEATKQSTNEAFTYPYAASAKLKSKYSVTELNTKSGGDAVTYFMEGSTDETNEDAGLSKAEKGIALHSALEYLDLREAYAHRDDEKWFSDYLAGLAAKGALSSDEIDSISVKALQNFANSNLASRAADSEFLMKEAPFNMKLPYTEAAGLSLEDTEEIIVQGVIDLLFEEGENIVIADYKSGWFDTSSYESEAARIRAVYGNQLRLYGKAAELIFEKPVKEKLIYMTETGITIDIP